MAYDANRTLEQNRADQAWTDVSQVRGADYHKDYAQLTRKVPADIQINGLGQTLAFIRAKGTGAHLALYEHMQAWLGARLGFIDLNQWVAQTATTDDYRRATVEALAFLNWLKRFAEAELR